MRKTLTIRIVVTAMVFFLSACSGKGNTPPAQNVPIVFGAYATSIEEPWDGVIHAALLKAQADGRILYTWEDAIGYSGEMEHVLRKQAGSDTPPDIIFGDAFGNEEAVRAVAAQYPDIAFVFGSSLSPSEPNLSVFDNWIHEPAYLSGLIAGRMTKSNVVGVVAGFPVPEVNRIVNAFIEGVHEANPDAKVLVDFINSWYDPEIARSTADAQVSAGADVIFAERFGAHEAAAEHGVWAIGNMSDQNSIAPDTIITGPVWHMEPTVDYMINQVIAGVYTAQDLKDFSSMAKGGASLAPYHGFEEILPPSLKELVASRQTEIIHGLFRVPINENIP
ncbi:MAG: BMP family protein [Anaerolineales bacterium]